MKRIGASRRKTRHKMRKDVSKKGKVPVTPFLHKFETGQKVALTAEPAVQKGLYNLNFYGKTGIIMNRQGRCYEVSVTDGSKQKTLIVHPVHLKKV